MKVRITLTEEALGSAPSNEDLLATYIASKAPTSELSAEEIDNIKAQNAEDRITVFYKSADGTPFQYNYQVKGMFKDSCQMLAKAGKAVPFGQSASASKEAIDWQIGDIAHHKKWGDGTVLSVTGSGQTQELKINFPEVGLKKLLASVAPIEKK